MQGYNPILNLNAIKRKQKGLTKELGGLSVGYFRLMTQGVEGQVVKVDNTAVDTVKLLAAGEGALAYGLLMQNVIDDSTYGQLQGTHMPNDTRARPGDAVGVLSGSGFGKTINYEGSGAAGATAYYNATTGKLSADTSLGTTNALPVVFVTAFDASVNGDNYDSTVYMQPTLIAFDFPISTAPGQTTIADGGVSTAKIADGAVTAAKVGAGAVVAAGIGAGAVTTAKVGAGAVTGAKLDLSGVKTLVAAGVAAAGPVTLTGAAVGDRVVSIFGTLTAGGPLVTKTVTQYETTITVANQIQQKAAAGDLSLSTFAFILIPAAA